MTSTARILSRAFSPVFRNTLLFSVLLLAALTLPRPALAAIYANFGDEILGEVPGPKEYKDWIEFDEVGFSISATVDTIGGGREGARASISDVSWAQGFDRSYTAMTGTLLEGEAIPDVTIDFIAPSASGEKAIEPYFKMEFTNVLLTSLDFSASSDERPDVSGSFTFEEMTLTYWKQRPDGSYEEAGSATWNQRTATGDIAAIGAIYAEAIAGPSLTPVPLPAPLLLLVSGLVPLLLHKRLKTT